MKLDANPGHSLMQEEGFCKTTNDHEIGPESDPMGQLARHRLSALNFLSPTT